MISGSNMHAIKNGNVTLDVPVPTRCAPDDHQRGKYCGPNTKSAFMMFGQAFVDRANEEGRNQDADCDVPECHADTMGMLRGFGKGLLPLGRLENCALRVPSKIVEPNANGRLSNARNSRPLGHSFSFAANGQECVISSIAGIFGGGNPAAIFGFVIAIIVNPIKLMNWAWWHPHVSKKVFELKPRITDLNPSTAPIFPAIILGVVASLNHCRPSVMHLVFCKAVFVAGSFKNFSGPFSLKASARLREPTAQCSTHRECRLAAIALANPSHPAVLKILPTTENSKSAESLADKIKVKLHKHTFITGHVLAQGVS